MKKIIILFQVLVVVLTLSSCLPSSEIPSKYVGFWGYDNGKQLGLYEEFAIFNNDFWKYQDVSKTSDGLEITLLKDSLSQKIKVGYLNDSTITFALSDAQKFDCIRTDDKCFVIRNKAKADTTNFKPVKDEVDSATILFYSRYAGNGFEPYFNNLAKYYGGNPKTFYYRWYYEISPVYAKPIDTAEHFGMRFKFKVPVQGVTEFSLSGFNIYDYENGLSYDNENYFMLQPGDTLLFVVDDLNQLAYSGTTVSDVDNKVYMADIHKVGRAKALYRLNNSYCENLNHNEDLDVADSAYVRLILEAKKADIELFQNDIDFMGENASKKFVKHGFDLIDARAASLILSHCSDKTIEEYFKSNVIFNEDELYWNSAVWELSTAWVDYNYRKKYGDKMHGLDFLKCDFIKDLGFSEKFVNRWLLMKAVNDIKSSLKDVVFHSDNQNVEQFVENQLQQIRNGFTDEYYLNLFNQFSTNYFTD